MKKLVCILSVFCLLASTNLNAQNCNQGKKMAENTWKKWAPWKPNITINSFKSNVNKVKKL